MLLLSGLTAHCSLLRQLTLNDGCDFIAVVAPVLPCTRMRLAQVQTLCMPTLVQLDCLVCFVVCCVRVLQHRDWCQDEDFPNSLGNDRTAWATEVGDCAEAALNVAVN